MGDQRGRSVECDSVIAEAWTFLDGECTTGTFASICQHLDGCASCLDHLALEGRMKNLIATRCGGEQAPAWLRWRRW